MKFSKNIIKVFGQTNSTYKLIEPNDKILVALSGGKDSLTLLHLIARYKRITPFDFDYEAVTLSYGMGEDYSELQAHCEQNGIVHKIIDSTIFEIAQNHIRENSSFCSFFSRMRRGSLYTYALENGFNKLALGHHLDDMVESYFMNMFYNGAMRALAPKYKASNGLIVIRPLIKIREAATRNFTVSNNLKAVGDEMCPGMRMPVKMPHARAQTKEWLKALEQDRPGVFDMIEASFGHIHEDTFLDYNRLKA
ncbi:MAG: hypothetical protein RL154_166 [Pseudomonadota bacterium]|jgi:tRNA(Ile)-lysidine synthase TilS/MesJ